MFKEVKILENLSTIEIGSNKCYKLKYNLKFAKEKGCTNILTFGGAFSNHIAAVAKIGKEQGFKTIGIIRGEELEETFLNNPTLQKAALNGMKFKFVSRTAYRDKNKSSFINSLKKEFPDSYIIPEGGTNPLAIKGCEEILCNQTNKFDILCVPVGTGATIAGIINASEPNQQIIGFPALKGNFLKKEISKFTKRNDNWSLNTAYHFGGYAKISKELITFINEFNEKHNVLLDPVYNAKMVFGTLDLIQKKIFSENKKIGLIITGGIQGIDGFNQQLKRKNETTIKI